MFKKFIEKIIFINNQTRTNEDIFGEIYKRGLWNENHAGGAIIPEKEAMINTVFHMPNVSVIFAKNTI